MTSPTAFDAMLQCIATLLYFVAAFLTLVLCTIMGLVIAELISERANVVRAYGAKPASSGTRQLSAVGREGRTSRFRFRHPIPKRIS